MSTNTEWKILEKVCAILTDERVNEVPSSEPVTRFHHPCDLKSLLDLSIELSPFRVPSEDVSEKQQTQSASSSSLSGETFIEASVEHLCRVAARLSVKTGHRFFCNQLFGGVDPVGLAGSWLTDALNTSQYTYEVGPVFTLIENVLIEKCLQLFNFPSGERIFSPGGSMNNMYAMTLARYIYNPDFKRKGVFGSPPLVAFTSVDAHYSFKKAAHWIGIGLDNLELVETDDRGQMCPSALEVAIKRARGQGKTPFFVNTTAGTTVLGAFDDFVKIAQICRRHNVWLHVDACLGGSVVLSPVKRDQLLMGINQADSLSWNPHKSLGVPLQCSVLLTRHEGLLLKCNSANADYLFQQDKFYDTTYDSGDKSVQCGRKVDAFKFWLMLKVRGLKAFQETVDHNFSLRDYFMAKLKDSKNFRLVLPEFQYTNVCFWYIPDRLLLDEGAASVETDAWWTEVQKSTTAIKEKMVLEGTAMISYSPLKHKGLGNFFRMVFTSFPKRTTADVDDLLDIIQRTGESL